MIENFLNVVVKILYILTHEAKWLVVTAIAIPFATYGIAILERKIINKGWTWLMFCLWLRGKFYNKPLDRYCKKLLSKRQ